MNISSFIKSNPVIKRIVYYLLVKQTRPRLWVRLLVTPFFNHFGADSLIRNRARMDIFPFKNFSLGDRSIIEDFCTIANGVGDVTVGDDTRVGLGSTVIGPVNIGNQVIIAQNVVLSGMNHSYTDINTPIRLQKVVTNAIDVEDEVWIGANVTITAGVTIGKHSVVAGGSVVTKNVPPYSVVAGNPAKIIKQFNFLTGEWVKMNQDAIENNKMVLRFSQPISGMSQ